MVDQKKSVVERTVQQYFCNTEFLQAGMPYIRLEQQMAASDSVCFVWLARNEMTVFPPPPSTLILYFFLVTWKKPKCPHFCENSHLHLAIQKWIFTVCVCVFSTLWNCSLYSMNKICSFASGCREERHCYFTWLRRAYLILNRKYLSFFFFPSHSIYLQYKMSSEKKLVIM